MRKILTFAGATSLLLLPTMTLAATPFEPTPPALETKVASYAQLMTLLQTIGKWMFGILLALAVIFLIYAAFLYLTSAGDTAKTDKAKNMIIYAIVAILVGVLAYGIVMLVQTLVT